MENKTQKVLNFPKGFLWGTSMSAYQVEGGNHNDWTDWERSEERLKKLEKAKNNPADYICGRACDFYHRYESDFDLAKQLNNNAIRFGIEWSRVQPKSDTWNIEAINQYRKILTAAKQRNLTTLITLWHWTLPVWVANEEGWQNEKTIQKYLTYVDMVVKELGGLVDYWFTFNEPTIHILNGYLRGHFPPNKSNPLAAQLVFKNLIAGHRQAYTVIHRHFPHAKVSANMMFNYIEPARRWFFPEWLLAKFARYYWDEMFINRIKNHLDFIGAHYYFHDRIIWHPPFIKNANKQVTDIGWEIYPKGIYHILQFLKKYNLPIIITENGIADHEDKYRTAFIIDHLRYIHQAIEEGADVRGYFHWSLIDNYEWEKGWNPKFGLYEVDRKTLERTPRPSAKTYAAICKNNFLVI